MSLYNEASLVMVPSGYKDGKLYSIKPTDGDGDFTFTRGSNLAATRVNSEGLIEKGRENLLVQSNTFDTTWSLGSGTVTGGQTGYDGSSDAWLFNYVSGANIVNQVNTQSGVQTYSVHAKGSVNNGLRLYAFGSTNCYAFFDLNLGTVEANLNLIDATIEDKGNGWYRCAITFDQTNTQLYMYLSNNQNSNASSGSILIQDAQLEQGLVATDYIETTTTTAQAGILEDMPRLDYSGGSCPSLLLEPQRTNLDTQSEYIAGWNAFSNLTRTANYAESPEGVDNATRLEFTGNGYTYNGNIPDQVSGSTYTMSCYAKRNDSGTQNFGFFVDGSGAVNSEMTLTSEWQRFTYTYTASNTSRQGLAGISGADVSVYGFQIEKDASYPTSYIPTYGASVTRGADSCYKTGISSLIGQTEGTMFLDVDTTNFEGDQRFGISDGTSANRIVLRLSGGIIQLSVVIGSTTQASISGSGSSGNRYKIAGVYKENDFALYINGSLADTDTSGTISGTFSRIANDNGFGIQNFYNPIKQAILFPTRLSNNDCEILTGTSYTSFASMASTLNYTQYE